MNPPILTSSKKKAALIGLLATACLAAADSASAQQIYNGWQATEVAPQSYGETPLLFGVAAFKICQLKTFLFAAVYVLGSIALVIFAIRALFTKFEMKQFIPILGALFIVASADLFIAWMSTDAFYCPTTLSSMSN
ncbi:hypothetical protein ACOI1H_16695 [Loktanella sp. DJP18]|uniref:hypothetical protein n=1 Tax=Loktanella sp. DJP18 TaxID=3409788 RepID=UPI003BB52801